MKVDPKLGGPWKDPKLGGPWKDPKLGGPWKDPKLDGPWKDPKLGGQWKVPSLVAIGMFQAWWPYISRDQCPFYVGLLCMKVGHNLLT